MLKRIALSDVEMGMFIHKMEGSWFKHPFWKSHFLLDGQDMLEQLLYSDLKTVIIDTERGRDTAVAKPAQIEQPGRITPPPSGAVNGLKPQVRAFNEYSRKRISALRNRRSVDLEAIDPVSLAKELGASGLVAQKAQQALSKVFASNRLGKSVNMRTVEPLVQDIFASVQRNPQAFSGLMRCKLHNEFVYRHALAVSALMVSLARHMRFSVDEIRLAGLAGLFLDIGTNHLPKELGENGDFRDVDQVIWQQHVALGANALTSIDNIQQGVIDACLQHHERVDGMGFPNRLHSAEISPLAKMAAICDTFDFLLLGSATQRALDPAAAIIRLREMAGAFDPDILHKFIESVGVYPVGSFVRLRSNRLAMVIDENPEDSRKPIVRTFFSLTSMRRIGNTTIDLANCFGEDDIMDVADFSGLALPDEQQLRELIFLSSYKAKR